MKNQSILVPIQSVAENLLGSWRFVVFSVIYMLGVWSLLLLDEATYYPLPREDGPVEMLGFLYLLFAGIVMLAVFFIVWRDNSQTLLRRLSYLALALLFLLLAGEEISWGQRVVGFDAPESIQEANYQNEFNLHNLNILGSGWSRRLFNVFWITLFVVIPVVALRIPSVRTRFAKYLPLFPVGFAPVFIANFFIAKGVDAFISEYKRSTSNEIEEHIYSALFLIASISLLMVVHKVRTTYVKPTGSVNSTN
jgi:hypothetical protein